MESPLLRIKAHYFVKKIQKLLHQLILYVLHFTLFPLNGKEFLQNIEIMIIIIRLKKKKKTLQTFDLGKGCLYSPFAQENSWPIRDKGDCSFDLAITVQLSGASS